MSRVSHFSLCRCIPLPSRRGSAWIPNRPAPGWVEPHPRAYRRPAPEDPKSWGGWIITGGSRQGAPPRGCSTRQRTLTLPARKNLNRNAHRPRQFFNCATRLEEHLAKPRVRGSPFGSALFERVSFLSIALIVHPAFRIFRNERFIGRGASPHRPVSPQTRKVVGAP
jgi:hypothetical protein